MKKISSIISLLVFLLGLYILFFQSGWLVISLSSKAEFPLGTLVSWGMIIAFSYFVYSVFPSDIVTKSGKRYLMLAKVFLFTGVFWGIISFLLSGNWNWSFHHMPLFFIWTAITLLQILVPFLILVILIFKRNWNKEI
ncbi:MAG: hypothetical protein R2757_09630 [Draconibacterium sp.]